MNTKFTKGEWQISRLYNTLLEINVNGLNICEIDCCGDFNETTGVVSPTEEERANANLISAAPDMYAILESLVNNNNIDYQDIDYKILELLAKARGE